MSKRARRKLTAEFKASTVVDLPRSLDGVPETPNERRLRAVVDAILATIRAADG